jgi:predicted house-cleaning NTP pyrophosphatase (Maf/HAM1 superfamily)
MLKKISEQYNIILGSASPRRKELLTDLGLIFSI